MRTEELLLEQTQRLLDAIATADWATYAELCAEDLSAFEPEAAGHRIDGLDFHRFYFDNASAAGPANTTIVDPHVRLVGDTAAVVTCIRLVQRITAEGPVTASFEETRVWQQRDGRWWHVHFHRSIPPGA